LLLCELLQLIERIQQWFVVVEFEQLVVVQFVLVFKWIFQWIIQWFVQRAFKLGSVVVTAVIIAAVIERGGTEQQYRRAKQQRCGTQFERGRAEQ
jgi:hypothetical protein